MAKALLAVRETDRDAAAWDDRVDALRQGWRMVVDCLIRDGLLSPEWNPDQAADAAWAMTSITVWEDLTLQRGWSTKKYVTQMKIVLKKILVKR